MQQEEGPATVEPQIPAQVIPSEEEIMPEGEIAPDEIAPEPEIISVSDEEEERANAMMEVVTGSAQDTDVLFDKDAQVYTEAFDLEKRYFEVIFDWIDLISAYEKPGEQKTLETLIKKREATEGLLKDLEEGREAKAYPVYGLKQVIDAMTKREETFTKLDDELAVAIGTTSA